MSLQAVLVAAVAFSGCLVNGQISTASCNTYDSAVMACNVPFNRTGESRSLIKYENVIIALTIDITPWCGENRALYSDIIKCLVNAYRACGTVDTRKLVAEGGEYSKAFDKICDQKSDFSGDCVDVLSINTCAMDKTTMMNLTVPAFTTSLTTLKPYYCSFSQYFLECIESNTKLNGCSAKPKTKDIYYDTFNELTPDECGGAMSVAYTSLLLTVSLLLNYII
ncbi:hypothetical protein SNE40_008312 [Patella caerulea]|uniref:Uncharacterized protein n=1 Tax=Patella caerulea TaxID=87958 RepID=A0AAN8Q3K0_PATCE